MSSGDKILIVGPAKAGKTAIANFLAKYPDAERAASPSQSYTPTVGTRFARRPTHSNRCQPRGLCRLRSPRCCVRGRCASQRLRRRLIDRVACRRARRILEFDASTHSAQSWKGGRESIELWDCSGDKKYEKCFPAIMKGAVGVILVYNPDDQEHINQLQYWHDKMIRPMKLNDEQVIVFQHRPQATFLPPKERKGTDCAHGGLPFRASTVL